MSTPSLVVSRPSSPVRSPSSPSSSALLSPQTPPHPSSTSHSRTRTRTRSLSPAPATSHSLSALGSPPSAHAPTPSAAGANKPPINVLLQGSTIRPAPVVPPSPSVPPSRPTSPSPGQAQSPVRSRALSGGGGSLGGVDRGAQEGGVGGAGEGAGGHAMGRSGSGLDLSHIFERDVEFAPSHLLAPSEAVDAAIPPVLTEAAVAFSVASSDPLTHQDLAALVLEAEGDAQAGSGWSSPVGTALLVGGGGGGYQPAQPSPLHAGNHHANASRSPVRGSRSFSPDSVTSGGGGGGGRGLARAVSPDSSTTFSVGTPPTSNSGGSPPLLKSGRGGDGLASFSPSSSSASPPLPALSLGPFSQRLAEALENEASKLPPGLIGGATTSSSFASARDLSPAGASDASTSPTRSGAAGAGAGRNEFTPLKPSLLLPFPGGSGSLSPSSAADNDPFSSFSPSPSSHLSSHPLGAYSPLASPSHDASNPFASSTSPSASPSGASGIAAPHPRRLSFYSYADLINEERIQELKGEGIGESSALSLSVGEGGGEGRVAGVGARKVSGGSFGGGGGVRRPEKISPPEEERERERGREKDKEVEGLEAGLAGAVLEA